MSNKIQYVLKSLEDPANPSVGPHLKMLSTIGLWRSDLYTAGGIFRQFMFYLIIAFFFSQYLKSCLSFNIESLKLILQYAPFHIGIVKACFFQKNFHQWQNFIEDMSSIERIQLAKDDKIQYEIINGYIKKNRRITYFFWTLAFFSNFSIFSEPFQKNQINSNGTSVYFYMFDGYTPFNKEPPGYYLSMFIQTVLGNIISVYVIGWDTLVWSIMIFFAGQLKISQHQCRQTIDVANPMKSHENIAKCHRFHITLINYHKRFNSLISPVMFAYLIVVSVNLGVIIIEIAKIQDDVATLFSSCVYIAACLVQLLIFYWYSSEVTVASTFTSYSTIESDWPSCNIKLQREVALLGLTTQKRLVFKAGPFNEMSLSTFIGILRGSYSFYTLLRNSEH